MDDIDVGGLRVAFERRGEGPPLVLLHGWPSNSREWRRQLEGLSDEFTVVAWDAPGAGRSSDPPSVDECGQAVGPVSEGEGLREGNLPTRRMQPDVYERARGGCHSAEDWPAEVVEQRLRLMLRNCDLPSDRWAPAWIETLLGADASTEMVAELRLIAPELHPAGTRVAMRAFAEADLRDVLARIDVPTLLLYGERDVRAPKEVWEPLHEGIRPSKLVLIPDAGHMIDIEAPDRFNAEVRDFLRDVGT